MTRNGRKTAIYQQQILRISLYLKKNHRTKSKKKMEKNGGQSEKEAKFYLGVVGLAVSSLPPVGFFARGLTIRQVTFRMGSELDQGSRDASKREKLRREEKKQNPFVQWRTMG